MFKNLASFRELLSHAFGIPGSNSGASAGSFQPSANQVRNETMQQSMAIDLRFHPAHGKAMKLHENSQIAERHENFFEHSVLFSHRPICVNESVAIQIKEITSEFNGPLRIGFTSVDPYNLIEESTENRSTVPLGRDLKNMPGVWIKGVHLFPIQAGTTIYWKVNYDGSVLYGVDEENGGVFLREVDVSGRLWAVVEAYGKVKAVQFINKTMILKDEAPLVNENHDDAFQYLGTGSSTHSSSVRDRDLSRFNVQNSNAATSFPVSSFSVPLPFTEETHRFCLVCIDRVKNAAFVSCGHLCMCYECALSFTYGQTLGSKRQLCPLCRREIDSILKIYQ